MSVVMGKGREVPAEGDPNRRIITFAPEPQSFNLGSDSIGDSDGLGPGCVWQRNRDEALAQARDVGVVRSPKS